MRGHRLSPHRSDESVSESWQAAVAADLPDLPASLLGLAQGGEGASKATLIIAILSLTTFLVVLLCICSVLWRQTSSLTPASASDGQAGRPKTNVFDVETTGPPQGELSAAEDEPSSGPPRDPTPAPRSPRSSFAGFQEDEAASRLWVDFQQNFGDSEDDSDGDVAGRIFPKWSQVEGQKVAAECFDHDWEFLSLKLDFDSEGEGWQVRAILRRCYVPILSIYRRLSTQNVRVTAQQPGQSCFGVGLRVAMNMLGPASSDGIGFLNDTSFTKTKAENLYKTALRRYMGELDEKAKPVLVHHESGLVRHQFTEFLVRVARTKFPKDSFPDAVDKMIEAVSLLALTYNTDVRGLFKTGSTALVAAVFEKHTQLLASIFLKYSAQQVTMTIEQWCKMLMAAEIYSMYPGFKHDYTAYAFRLGVSTVSDEQYSSDFQHMSFTEYKRGLCAVMFLSEYRTVRRCTTERLAEILEQWFLRDLAPLAIKEAPRKALLTQLEQPKGALTQQTKRRSVQQNNTNGNGSIRRLRGDAQPTEQAAASDEAFAAVPPRPPQNSRLSSARSSVSTSPPGRVATAHRGSRSNSGPSTGSSNSTEKNSGSREMGGSHGSTDSKANDNANGSAASSSQKARRQSTK